VTRAILGHKDYREKLGQLVLRAQRVTLEMLVQQVLKVKLALRDHRGLVERLERLVLLVWLVQRVQRVHRAYRAKQDQLGQRVQLALQAQRVQKVIRVTKVILATLGLKALLVKLELLEQQGLPVLLAHKVSQQASRRQYKTNHQAILCRHQTNLR
jgi:hypothetical protein